MIRSSNNYEHLRVLLSKVRQIHVTQDISYLVVYAFLYKYCSDSIRDYLLRIIEKKEVTLDEALVNPEFQEFFKRQALLEYGYYINNPDCFFDEVVNNRYQNDYSLYHFFSSFAESVEFGDNSNYEKYFNFIFDSVKEVINFNKYEFEGENHIIVKDIIDIISRMDIFERQFPFEKVFDKICQSRLLQVDTDPAYISEILSGIVGVHERGWDDVYNPFLNDASSVINLYPRDGPEPGRIYAKSQDKITYCSNIVKFLIGCFDLERIFLEYGSPFESADINGASFDVITSRIPPITAKNIRKLNRAQRMEIAKRDKRKELESLLTTQFNIKEESLANELNNSLESLLDNMELDDFHIEFTGEYESLKDSEYLFLINLINSLKDDGIFVVAMSQSFLFKNTLETLRKYLTFEKNYIDTIISIPNELTRPHSSEIVVVFKKNRYDDDILFIDMSGDYKVSRERYRVPGLFKKNLTFDRKYLECIVDVYKYRKVIDKFSNRVCMSEIVSNEFNLSISRYVDTFEGEFITLSELKNEKEEITSKIKELNKKIDLMMDDLDIRF